MALANNLTGVAATDGPMLDKLQGEIAAALQRNQGLQSVVCLKLAVSNTVMKIKLTILGNWRFCYANGDESSTAIVDEEYRS
jgi:hypothetical protein